MLGTYIVLRVSGLTQLALTVVGGTGLVGLAVGIAFRDITENFLASIFLSMQRPFETGDLVEVSGVTGYVQQLNVRTTILMALDGNLVQIPNASVYKSNLRNFTTNSSRRDQFDVGIGYDDAINEAQEIALQVLTDHPAVLSEPEPLVLVDSLGKATVNLRVYFWINGREHSLVKVRSSVIRQVKRAFQNHGISMPDEAREVVFPQGIPITMLDGKPTGTPDTQAETQLPAAGPSEELDVVSTKAEGGLQSEAGVLDEQARQAQPLREGENLLPNAPDHSSSDKSGAKFTRQVWFDEDLPVIKLKQLWGKLRASFWFVPSLIVAFSTVLAVGLIEVGFLREPGLDGRLAAPFRGRRGGRARDAGHDCRLNDDGGRGHVLDDLDDARARFEPIHFAHPAELHG